MVQACKLRVERVLLIFLGEMGGDKWLLSTLNWEMTLFVIGIVFGLVDS